MTAETIISLAPISLGMNFLYYFTLSALEWIAKTESKTSQKKPRVLIDGISHRCGGNWVRSQ